MKNFFTTRTFTILTFMLVAVAAGIILSTYNNSYQPTSPAQQESTAALASAEIGRPVYLEISSLNIDHEIETVGLTKSGAMDTPKDPSGVGWYSGSARPGAAGSAVITGHYGWKNNLPAIFDNLSKIEIGDTVTIKDEKGVSFSFAVSALHTYPRDAIVPEIFNATDTRAHLNIITCTGRWNSAIKEYDERLVVFTVAK